MDDSKGTVYGDDDEWDLTVLRRLEQHGMLVYVGDSKFRLPSKYDWQEFYDAYHTYKALESKTGEC